jgi:hypothetical protein
MENITVNNNGILINRENEIVSSDSPFIQANTLSVSLAELRDAHLIPVYVKDNEPTISQYELIDTTMSAVSSVFQGEHILKPSIRVSHPIKGRIPDARDKAAAELLECEKTLYYERMMFAIEVSTVTDMIGGHTLALTIGGVKSYNQDNLYNRKGSEEHFKLFIGFKNRVCTNLCVWSDGYAGEIKVRSIKELQFKIHKVLEMYNPVDHLRRMDALTKFHLTEQQVANLIGRCRMYQYLSVKEREGISAMRFGDQQISSLCKDYYSDASFCKDGDGNIDLWRLYNLFTGANKSTYIDSFLDRSLNAFEFVEQIKTALENGTDNWFIN